MFHLWDYQGINKNRSQTEGKYAQSVDTLNKTKSCKTAQQHIIIFFSNAFHKQHKNNSGQKYIYKMGSKYNIKKANSAQNDKIGKGVFFYIFISVN